MSSVPLSSRRKPQLFVAVAAAILVSLVILKQTWYPDERIENISPVPAAPPPEQICRELPGAEDVLVVQKTGATEAHEKLPVHFRTTLRCIPHWIVFSDLEEDIEGHRVHDVLLGEIDDHIKNTVEEFRLYKQIQEWHAQGIEGAVFDESVHKQAWVLDKWKFLPLMKKALQTRPESKWFVFIEADTYLVWSNLLQWLSRLNHEEPLYIGGQAWIGDTEFAHGGTGFIISNKALNMVVQEYTNNIKQWHETTQRDWAGDCILAKAMKAQGIRLTESWPILQGETPYTLDYTERHWCHPVVSYHHMPSEWIERMWNFEQEWLADQQRNANSSSIVLPSEPIRHRDVFAHFVRPEIAVNEKPDWHNLSPDKGSEGEAGVITCRAICQAATGCVQWLATVPGKCKISKVVRLGSQPVAKDDVDPAKYHYTSGWVVDRVDAFVEGMGECKTDWIMPKSG